MTTNRTSDGHSDLTFSLYDNANMTLTEEGIEFQVQLIFGNKALKPLFRE